MDAVGTACVRLVALALVVTAALGVDSLGAAFETVVALLLATQGTALTLELVHGDGWQRRGTVVLRGGVVHFLDGDGRVDDLGLDNFLLDYRLDSLVDVAGETRVSN
jgi:hypothetical protein